MYHDDRCLSGKRFLRNFLPPCVLLVLLGCGGNKSGGEISGTVTYQGKPLAEGTVAFHPVSGKETFGTQIEEDGSYRISNVPPGDMKVTVETGPLGKIPDVAVKRAQKMLKSGGKQYTKEEIKNLDPRMRRAALENITPGRYLSLPPQYANPDQSGLTYTVTEGKQQHDIELK